MILTFRTHPIPQAEEAVNPPLILGPRSRTQTPSMILTFRLNPKG